MREFGAPFDIQAVMRTVGPSACSRGLAYFESGAVLSLFSGLDDGDLVLIATVQGSELQPYSVTVYPGDALWEEARGGSSRVVGECTCPVGVNCKHVAAVMFAAGRMRPSGDVDAGAGAGAGAYAAGVGLGGQVADWELALNLRESGRGSARPDPPRVALLIEPRTRGGGQLALSMRPVLLGDRGRWVRSGISWRDMTYPSNHFPEGPVSLLKEILTQLGSGNAYYRSDPTTIDLVTFPSPRIWSVLGEARAASMPLISSVEGTAVELAQEIAQAGLDIHAEADADGRAEANANGRADVGVGVGAAAWSLRPEITVGGVPIESDMTLFGEPAHGVAWLTAPGEAGSTGNFDTGPTGDSDANFGVGPVGSVGSVGSDGARAASADGAAQILHLARLVRPLEAAPRRLISMSTPVTVPGADQRRFIRDYLPVIMSHLAVASRDGSVDLPRMQPGRLVMTVRRDRERLATVSWQWRYIWDSEPIYIPLGAADCPELRDADAEGALLATVLNIVHGILPLSRRGALGRELVPNATLSALDAVRFARNVVPKLSALDGVDTDISDDALAFREATAAPVVTVSGSVTTHTDWLGLTVTISVDGQEVPFADVFRALATGQELLVLPSGTYFLVDLPELQHLRALIEESWSLADRESESLPTSRYNASLWAELDAMGVLDEQARAWSASIRDLARISEIPSPPPPVDFTATLRPYQQAGYTWLSFLFDHQLGGVLADDMGLGKTVQSLAMMCRARAEKPGAAPFLVVAPTSVVPNWADEAGRFAPRLKAVQIMATEARRGAPLAEACAGADIVITSYALFRLEYEAYEAISWSGLLLDEAQQIKNHLGKGYRCARGLSVPFKVAITGTPMENNLMELWAMFSIVAPGLLGTPTQFAERYRNPIERGQDSERLVQLRRRIRPLLMRRTKSEVVSDLPPKTEQIMELELGPKHRRAYQRFLQRERRKVLGLIGDMDRNRFQIFRSLTLLRQAALDVALVDPDQESPPSTKLDALMELVESAAAEGHRMLVFSQFTRFLARARDRLDAASVSYCYLDGRTRNRAAVLDDFRSGSAPVFLISLKAGGVGLNLTEADYCVLTDPWWNPATEQQAIDRTHRIGQTKPVMVYRLVAKDTIEDKVMALSARKAALVASVMADGGIGTTGLTAADVRGLLD